MGVAVLVVVMFGDCCSCCAALVWLFLWFLSFCVFGFAFALLLHFLDLTASSAFPIISLWQPIAWLGY